MKKIKIIVAILLIAIGFLFNGELCILYLDDFQNSFYQARIDVKNLASDVDDEEFVQDFISTGEKYNVEFFFIDSKNESTFKKNITIYGTNGALEHLQRTGIPSKAYSSILMGDTVVKHVMFEEISNIAKYGSFYFVGDQSKDADLQLFKSDLMDKYGGSFPKKLGSDTETLQNLYTVWGILLGITLMLSMYEVAQQKKEVMVRIILGEDVRTIFFKSALVDTVAFTAIFLIIPILLSQISNSYFKISYVVLAFIIFLLLNIVVNSTLLRINYKKNLSGNIDGRKIILVNYFFKTASTLLAIIILASNISIVKEGYDLYKQRDFFENHKDYSYYRMSYKNTNNLGKTEEDDDLVNQMFYEKYQNNSSQYIDLTDNFDSPYPILLMNQSSLNEIAEENSSLKTILDTLTENKVYLLLPSSISIDSFEHYVAKEVQMVFFGNDGGGTVEYSDDIDIIGIHLNDMTYKSKWTNKPIILYNNMVPKIDLYYANDIMYNITEDQFQKFLQEFQLEDQISSKSNVLSVYEYNWGIMLRTMQLTIILSMFILVIEVALMFIIIKLEYRYNAVEISLKKVMGYTLLDRNIRLIRITVISLICSMFLAFILSKFFNLFEGGINILVCGIILLLAEMIIILLKAKKTEKRSINTILKGENL